MISGLRPSRGNDDRHYNELMDANGRWSTWSATYRWKTYINDYPIHNNTHLSVIKTLVTHGLFLGDAPLGTYTSYHIPPVLMMITTLLSFRSKEQWKTLMWMLEHTSVYESSEIFHNKLYIRAIIQHDIEKIVTLLIGSGIFPSEMIVDATNKHTMHFHIRHAPAIEKGIRLFLMAQKMREWRPRNAKLFDPNIRKCLRTLLLLAKVVY